MTSRLKHRTGSSREVPKSAPSVGTRRSGCVTQAPDFKSMECLRFRLESEGLLRVNERVETALGRYCDLYHLAPSGCVILDKEGLVVDARLHPATLFGQNSWLGRSFRFAVVTEDQSAFNLARKLLDASGRPQICEIRLRRDDGSFWAQLELLPGHHGHAVIILIDITSRKTAELRLEEGQRRMVELLGRQT